MLIFSVSREMVDSQWMTPEVLATSPFALVGAPGAIIEGLYERRERWGLSYYVCFGDDIDRMSPVGTQLADVR
jgi:hypothetical protein